ncbi:MAG: M20/M25/M40 family metallo-hydrolase, partial [Trueperaceae bacterium]|nr:M20/M25/M40 family metallo-hydrolase [Trueperaceae bacterium]
MTDAAFAALDLPGRARAARDAYVATLSELVRHESPSLAVDACNALADLLQRQLEEDGWTVTRAARDGAGDVVTAHLAGEAAPDPGAPHGTLLLAHYDTVWPLGTLETMPLRVDEDVLAGPGAFDMKAGIATARHAAALARAAGPLPERVTLLVTSDEEVGSGRSRDVIEATAREHARVLVLEPGTADGSIKVARKGVGMLRFVLEGVPSHAGLAPEDGASALREFAHLLPWAEALADPAVGTTLSVTMASGGSAGNVVAAHAEAHADLRVARADEADRVLEALSTYVPRDPRVTATLRGEVNRPPMEATPANRALADHAKGLAEAMGLPWRETSVGGASDGNFTSAAGVATLDGLGAVGDGAHAHH